MATILSFQLRSLVDLRFFEKVARIDELRVRTLSKSFSPHCMRAIWSSFPQFLQLDHFRALKVASLVLLLSSYMYSEAVDITPENVINLAYLSDKYLVHKLRDQCIHSFRHKVLTRENVLEYASQGQCVIPELQTIIILMIQVHAGEIFNAAEAYKKLTHDTLRHILEKDFLNCSEYCMYRVCCRWAEHQCEQHHLPVNRKNMAGELRDLLPVIRFPVMTLENFTTVSRDGLLAAEDRCKVFEYLCRGQSLKEKFGHNHENHVTDVPFNCVWRSNYYIDFDSVNEYLSVEHEGEQEAFFAGHPLPHVELDCLTGECRKGYAVLDVHEPVSVCGFRLHLNELLGSREAAVRLHVTITRESLGNVISQYSEMVTVQPAAFMLTRFYYHEVRLRKAVTLKPRRTYSIAIKCDHPLYYYRTVVRCDWRDLVVSGGASLPFRINWLQTQKSCYNKGGVSNLIFGIKYMLK